MRRRKAGGVWLPTSPNNTFAQGGTISDPAQSAWHTNFLVANPAGAGGIGILEQELVGDFNEEEIAGVAGATLNDVIQGYKLRRVVGNLFIGVAQIPDATPETATYAWAVTAGIIVRRVDKNGNAVNTDPDPQSYEAQRDPWIWRMSWILQNYRARGDQAVLTSVWPSNNVDYPSGLTGHHVDQKTFRTVGPEERLFLDIACLNLNGDNSDQAMNVYWDFRFFGYITRNAQGNRRNASR